MRTHPDQADPSATRTDQQGMALVFALFFSILVLGITVAGTMSLKAHRDTTQTRFASNGQAIEFARSGLVEALGWFRKQTAQPVTTFSPQLDQAAQPPVLDTMDSDIGIVREFRIHGSLWGRYEVWKEWGADPDPERLDFRTQVQCEDISDERGNLSSGSIWRLRSVGYVFRRQDNAAAFDESPNRVIATQMVETEIRRLALQPPGQAALCIQDASNCYVLLRGRVFGGSQGAGVYYPFGTGNVTVAGWGASVTGVPPLSATNNYADDLVSVFGVNLTELKGMADSIIADPNEFPSPLPKEALIVAETNLRFTSQAPLSGTGILVVTGDVTIEPGSYSTFSGLLYVEGNLIMGAPTELQGAVVVKGAVLIQGHSDFATITFDDGIINSLRQRLGTYRQSSATYRPLVRDNY